MFEKEAEEYTVENVCSSCYFEKPCENKCEAFGCADSKTYVLKAFKDGAEFGYNKANEWHYVKDGNPDNENDILCQISKDEVEVGYYHTKQKRYYTIDGQPIDVIKWKEIVFPKEIE